MSQDARETESEKRIRNTQNKPCRVELVTSPNRDYRPYAISENSFFIYHLYWEFTDGFVQGKPNIDEYFWIRSSVEVRNNTGSAWIIVKGSRSRKLDFPNICNLFHRFSKYIYNDNLLFNVIESFLSLFWQTKEISPARRLLVSHLFSSYSWILFLTKYDKIMS